MRIIGVPLSFVFVLGYIFFYICTYFIYIALDILYITLDLYILYIYLNSSIYYRYLFILGILGLFLEFDGEKGGGGLKDGSYSLYSFIHSFITVRTSSFPSFNVTKYQ